MSMSQILAKKVMECTGLCKVLAKCANLLLDICDFVLHKFDTWIHSDGQVYANEDYSPHCSNCVSIFLV